MGACTGTRMISGTPTASVGFAIASFHPLVSRLYAGVLALVTTSYRGSPAQPLTSCNYRVLVVHTQMSCFYYINGENTIAMKGSFMVEIIACVCYIPILHWVFSTGILGVGISWRSAGWWGQYNRFIANPQKVKTMNILTNNCSANQKNMHAV